MSGPVGTKAESMKSYIWLQTGDGLIQQVEQDVALFCPFIRHTLPTSGGSSEARPIILPETVTSTVLSAILDYCQFYHLPGRSNLELKYFNKKFIWVHRESLTELLTPAKSLQMTQLVDLLCGPLVKLVERSTDEEIRQAFALPDDITEEDKWTPIQINTDNQEVRLFNKLCARKRKEIKQYKKMKNAEVEALPVDNRSIDELMSFINGENEGHKETKSSKSKNKNYKGKDKQKPSNKCHQGLHKQHKGSISIVVLIKYFWSMKW